LEKWLSAINRHGFIPKKSSRICNIHFLKTNFVDSLGGSYKLKLRPSTIPSVFPGRLVASSKLLSTFNKMFYAYVVYLKKFYIINSFNIQWISCTSVRCIKYEVNNYSITYSQTTYILSSSDDDSRDKSWVWS